MAFLFFTCVCEAKYFFPARALYTYLHNVLLYLCEYICAIQERRLRKIV